MRVFSDTWTMTRRSLRHIVRSPDTIITVVAMPIALMLLFVYVFGGDFGHVFRTGPVKYVDFIVPGIVAMTVVSGMFGLLAKTVEGAGSFSYILLLLVFVSPGFAPTSSMSAPVRAFAEHQPITPIVDTMRSLLIYGHAGDNAWAAFAWCGGLLAVCYVASLRFFRARRAPMVVSQ